MYSRYFLTIGLLWAIVSLPLLVTAWWCAYTRKSLVIHKKLMVLLTIMAWLFILSYLSQYVVPLERTVNIPKELVPWFVLHAMVGFIPLFGAPLMVWARIKRGKRSRFSRHLNSCHATYGRIIVSGWTFTHAGGILNYLLLS